MKEHVHGHEHEHKEQTDAKCTCGCCHDHHVHHGEHHHEEHHYEEHHHEEHHHEHHHYGEHEDACGCGHHHESHEAHEHRHHHDEKGHEKGTIFILENLGCANCAAKMERRINALDGVEEAVITFATKQLRIKAKHPVDLLPAIQEICASIESEVVVKEREHVSKTIHKHNDGQNKSGRMGENTKTLISLILGAVLFAAGAVMHHMNPEIVSVIVFVCAYIILGGGVVITALKNVCRGQIFDENFLMTIATLGAFAIREWPEAVGVMLFYRIGELFEHIAVEKSRAQIMEAADMRPEVVNKVCGETIDQIPADNAIVGDILLVRPGDRIPLDGVVVEGESRIDVSPVTGEPVPVKASVGDSVISGCVNTSGLLKIRVEKVLQESMVTRILEAVENAAANKPKMDRFITRFARIYTPVVIAIALATALIPSFMTGQWHYWIYTALTFLMMSCPCALVLSVPLAFFSAIGAGSKRGILFKGGVSVETLAGISAVVMDKTGTITEGNFMVQKAVPAGSLSPDELLELGAVCEMNSTHPIGVSIVEAAKERNLKLCHPDMVEEIAGYGIRAVISGKEVLCGNQKLMAQFHIDLSQYQPEHFGTEVLLAKHGKFIGHIVISDTIKTDAKPAVDTMHKMGLTTVMLTGDGEGSANAVAKETGIDEVYSKLLPQDKLTIMTTIREKHGSVLFVGDGINDAPVLAGADVGAAMGSGADAAIEAADVVFMTSSMEAVPQSVSIAKAAVRIAWQNVVFALVIKIAVMILGLIGFASMWLAIFADTGVAMICILNSIRVLYAKLKL